jgi:hypothetical protein
VPPAPAHLVQFRLKPRPIGVQFRLKPRPIGVQLGMTVGHGLQFREHDGHITGHANLIGPGVPEQRRF